ncbi:MAG: hypothetical protein GX128_02700 [Bacteroidales bacterium]|jgi:hypothetical protein|nr:hypothetical protein [Bacteroidales bacterium]
MISAKAFMAMTVLERAATVLEHGTELSSRIYMFYVVKLYCLGDFLVELWYRQNENKIEKIEVVDSEEIFHFYEKEIDISDLFRHKDNI